MFILCIYLSCHLHLFVYLSIYLSNCLSICLSICPSMYLSVCLSILSIYISVCLSVHPSIYLSIYPSIYPHNHSSKFQIPSLRHIRFILDVTLILTHLLPHSQVIGTYLPDMATEDQGYLTVNTSGIRWVSGKQPIDGSNGENTWIILKSPFYFSRKPSLWCYSCLYYLLSRVLYSVYLVHDCSYSLNW